MTHIPRLYSVGEAGTALGVSKSTVRRYLHEGVLTGFKLRGKWSAVMIPESEILRILEGREKPAE